LCLLFKFSSAKFSKAIYFCISNSRLDALEDLSPKAGTLIEKVGKQNTLYYPIGDETNYPYIIDLETATKNINVDVDKFSSYGLYFIIDHEGGQSKDAPSVEPLDDLNPPDPTPAPVIPTEIPATSSEAPVATSSEEPVATSSEEPVATSSEEPVATSSEEPVATSSEEPVATSSEAPATTSSEAPATTSSELTYEDYEDDDDDVLAKLLQNPQGNTSFSSIWSFHDPTIKVTKPDLSFSAAKKGVTMKNPSQVTLGSFSIVFYDSKGNVKFASPYLKTGMTIQTSKKGQVKVVNKVSGSNLRLLNNEPSGGTLTIIPDESSKKLSVIFENVKGLENNNIAINVKNEKEDEDGNSTGEVIPLEIKSADKVETQEEYQELQKIIMKEVQIIQKDENGVERSVPLEDSSIKDEVLISIPTPGTPTPNPTPDESGNKSSNNTVLIVSVVVGVVALCLVFVLILYIRRWRRAKRFDAVDEEITV